MKSIFRILFLLIALSTVAPVFSQSGLESIQAQAEQGDADAQYSLGSMYRNGNGVAQNDREAVRWYLLAAEQGIVHAQYNLGVIYSNGETRVRNDQEAFKWHRLAAQQGLADAQNSLGWMYANGRGVTQDDARAYVWYSARHFRHHINI